MSERHKVGAPLAAISRILPGDGFGKCQDYNGREAHAVPRHAVMRPLREPRFDIDQNERRLMR
ncbi:MAG: hypothetical protein AAF668_08025 [Pseudomonadota bacterium]